MLICASIHIKLFKISSSSNPNLADHHLSCLFSAEPPCVDKTVSTLLQCCWIFCNIPLHHAPTAILHRPFHRHLSHFLHVPSFYPREPPILIEQEEQLALLSHPSIISSSIQHKHPRAPNLSSPSPQNFVHVHLLIIVQHYHWQFATLSSLFQYCFGSGEGGHPLKGLSFRDSVNSAPFRQVYLYWCHPNSNPQFHCHRRLISNHRLRSSLVGLVEKSRA